MLVVPRLSFTIPNLVSILLHSTNTIFRDLFPECKSRFCSLVFSGWFATFSVYFQLFIVLSKMITCCSIYLKYSLMLHMVYTLRVNKSYVSYNTTKTRIIFVCWFFGLVTLSHAAFNCYIAMDKSINNTVV